MLHVFRPLVYAIFICIALVPLLGGHYVSFLDIVRLIFIVGGIVYLLRQNRLSDLFYTLLIFGIFTFVLAQFTWDIDRAPWLFAIGFGLAAAGALAVSVSMPIGGVTRLDRQVGLAVILFALIALISQLAVGAPNAVLFYQMGYVLEVGFVYFAVSRYIQFVGKNGQQLRVIHRLLIGTLGIVVIVGGVRVVVAYHCAEQSLEAYHDMRYDEFADLASDLDLQGQGIDLKAVSFESVLEVALASSSQNKQKNELAFVAIGSLAEQKGSWQLASLSYKEGLKQFPESGSLYTRLCNLLVAQDLRKQAMDVLAQGEMHNPDLAEFYFLYGVEQARQDRPWPQVAETLGRGWHLAGCDRLFWEHLFNREILDSPVTISASALIPKRYHAYLQRLSLYEWVYFFQSLGFAVYHPGMTLAGALESPANIEVVSGASPHWQEERILLNGIQVSQHRRGYNVAVIHPESGLLESSENFDTHGEAEAGSRLADFIDNITDGRIVVGTIADEGSRYIHPETRNVMHALGLVKIPEYPKNNMWSHAFIGVKGQKDTKPFEVLAEYGARIRLGVLKRNFHTQITDVDLMQAAKKAPSGIAIWLNGEGLDGEIQVAVEPQLAQMYLAAYQAVVAFENKKLQKSHYDQPSLHLSKPAIRFMLGTMLNLAKKQALGADAFKDIGAVAESLEAWDIALSIYQTAVQEIPENDRFYVHLGHILLKKGQVEKARLAFMQGASKLTSGGGGELGLGLISLRSGAYDQAAIYLQQAMEKLGVLERVRQRLDQHAFVSLTLDDLLGDAGRSFVKFWTVYDVVTALKLFDLQVLHGSGDRVSPPVDIVVTGSASPRDSERILVDGQDVSPHQRGYNLVVIDGQSGQVADRQSFDTHGDNSAGQLLADYLGKIAPHNIVAGSIHDEGIRMLGKEGQKALQRLGLQAPLAYPKQAFWSHAFIAAIEIDSTPKIEGISDRSTQVQIGALKANSPLNLAISDIKYHLVNATKKSKLDCAVYFENIDLETDVHIYCGTRPGL